ncbi:MAG: GIY-YIG nuclease family protein [Alphaproteobacteria bacterium]|nr:GIY-YIG nuclease family protein [Alphaproteobacteria bacterium]
MTGTGDERRYFVYIMASKPWGTLYVGLSGDLQSRVYQHRNGLIAGFTKTYGIKTLVHFEEHETAASAIHREKRLKKWPRAWKINLIRTDNPDWKDLAADWYPPDLTPELIVNWVARIARESATRR